jgi:ABC-type multidrug transport system ATPase subunit
MLYGCVFLLKTGRRITMKQPLRRSVHRLVFLCSFLLEPQRKEETEIDRVFVFLLFSLRHKEHNELQRTSRLCILNLRVPFCLGAFVVQKIRTSTPGKKAQFPYLSWPCALAVPPPLEGVRGEGLSCTTFDRMSSIIDVKGLTKQFKELTAVDSLSFSVPKGEVYGFLGQNGAGKSTTIRMLLTLVRPTSGSISILGKDLAHHRKEILQQVGAIIEKPDMYKYLTALENISIMARLSGVKLSRAELLKHLDRVGLLERATSKVKTFSQGMKQRLGIACALVNNPQLIILDEPTNGLDPQGIADVRNLVLRLSRDEGKTIFISSHLLSEIEMIADSMLIIDRGRKVAEGKVNELLHPADTLVQLDTVNNVAARLLLQQSQWQQFLQDGEEGILLKMHREKVPQLNLFLVQQGVEVYSLRSKHSLEDYFLSLTTPNQHVAAYAD